VLMVKPRTEFIARMLALLERCSALIFHISDERRPPLDFDCLDGGRSGGLLKLIIQLEGDRNLRGELSHLLRPHRRRLAYGLVVG
jgi:hypothetical protein